MSDWIGLSEEERKSRLIARNVNISVVGFGYIGASIGLSLSAKGFSVTGIDKNDDLLTSLSE